MDQFYASLSAEKKPKHGVLIFINCSILLQVIDCNNQRYERENPRLAYVTANLKGIGLVNIVGIYLPANGGVGEKLSVIGELRMLCQRISTTSDKFILGGDMNIDLDKEMGGKPGQKLREVFTLCDVEDMIKRSFGDSCPPSFVPRNLKL